MKFSDFCSERKSYVLFTLKHLKLKALLCNPPFLDSWWRPRKSWRMMWELLKAWRRSRGNCRRTWREPVRNWKKRPSLMTSWRKPRTGFSRSLMTLWWTWTTRDRSSQPWRRNRRSLTRYCFGHNILPKNEISVIYFPSCPPNSNFSHLFEK